MISLELAQVSVTAAGHRILQGVDLLVDPGSWVGLLGPNGAGKTTLLRAVLGQVESTGRLRLGHADLREMSPRERARLIAAVPQRPALPPEMTVADYVLLGRTPHIPYLGYEGRMDLEAASAAAALLELSGLERRLLGTLSGGELQRAVLARALAQQAPLLLLDEPISSLDVGHQQVVLELVARLRTERGLTVISALHDLTLAAQFCDRLVLVAGGRVVAEGAASVVLTEGAIREHYGASVRVLEDGDGGVVVIPVRDRQPWLASNPGDAAGVRRFDSL